MANMNLIREAIKVREKAYCPYSNFKVGAAVLFEDGNIYTGCNIENASFGATNCAERTAIFNGVSNGNRVIKEIALIGDTNSYTYPCGICRQVITEFAENENIKIYIVKNENDFIEKTLEEIMPGSFTKRDLE
ncbi:MAG: cytidine deaminase [Clostridium baratii]|uniref:Cytidine deaminase n=2 Tax=Clostridium baratii TaxID=1561 RepID=A0A0A7FYD2_9CLOT|nr:cytidine deaminase [Clostridium baratii]AIY84627.1 cytidine deaminase [Clostridium baratii str. Sullivan]MBS6006454.1 cytidine deaminase [Clostridium baratii]MDU1053876.1 cytidine deaminase [Clostridium baratii]MDU4910779.1 cytidine deaminase [Clostridium baratii]CUO90467.1 cytidine deaminase [Clostridium baratii]